MIADRLRALVAELRSSHGWIGFTRNDYANRLEQILAEDAGGWRPVIEAVAAERRRQVESEGWSPAHDDTHRGNAMLHAAITYALAAASDRSPQRLSELARRWWPWSFEWWKPITPRRDLIKAAALIVAEIERLDRIPEPPPQEPQP